MKKSGQSRTYECSKCGKVYSTSSNLNKHIKNCKGDTSSISSSDEQDNLNTFDASTMMEMISQLPQLIQELKEHKNENIKLKNELKEKDLEIKSSVVENEPPYDREQLIKAIYKYNPYTRQYAIRHGGYTSKDYRNWYVLKYFNILDYPDDEMKFYKKCLTNILDNIPTDKLPYRVKDANRYIYEIYDYNEKRWFKGKTNDLIDRTIKFIILYINASFKSAINETNTLSTHDFNALENRNMNMNTFHRMRSDLQSQLNYKFGLPEHDVELDEEQIINFYKRNFVKTLNDRFKNNEIDDENIIQETTIREVETHDRNRLNLLNVDFEEDEGYNTDTDIKKNPYFD